MGAKTQAIRNWYQECVRRLTDPQQPNQVQIVTPNLRLTRFLHDNWDTANCWLRPEIFPLNHWLEQLWQQHQDQLNTDTHNKPNSKYQLLNPHQVHQLWEQVLNAQETHDDFEPLANQQALIQTVETADNLVQTYALNPAEFEDQPPEIKAFKHWFHQFNQICEKHHWLCTNRLTDFLWQQFFSKQKQKLKHLGVFGFQELTPHFQTLLEKLAEIGIEVRPLSLNTTDAKQISFNIFNTTEQEIQEAIQWAQGETTQQTEKKTVAIIVPNLSERRDEIESLASLVFNPHASYFTDDIRHLYQINISASQALVDYPLVYQSLKLVQALISPLGENDLWRLLVSPFWKNADFIETSMALKSKLSGQRTEKMLLKNWLTYLTQADIQIPALTRLVQTPAAHPKRITADNFIGWLFSAYQHLGWPGSESLDSKTFQLWGKYVSLLEGFSNCLLDPSERRTSLAWFHLLQSLCAQTQFQPQALSNQIHILGSLEAAGQPFDAIWMLGMDQQQWPSKSRANPFVPIKIQRQHQVPHSSPERELSFAKDYLTDLTQAAPSITFSCAKLVNEKNVSPSPLVLELAHQILYPDATGERLTTRLTHADAQLQYLNFQDESGTQLTTSASPQPVRGGVSHFKAMRLCPFKAYARYRLNLRHIPKPTALCLNPLEQGNIIHAVLEHLWNDLNDQRQLSTQTATALSARVKRLTTSQLARSLGRQIDLLPQVYLDLEIDRIENLVLEWLKLEQTRTPFSVIATEKQSLCLINNLEVKGRIDRIDQLKDGSHILIDYKTGQVQPADLFSDTLIDPQLPIYCLFSESDAAGLCIGKISAPAPKLLSKVKANTPLFENEKDKHPNHHWQEQLQVWSGIIEQLATAIQSGCANTAPIKGKATCNQCEYSHLCRIETRTLT